jgi:transcriptional regulator with XRE-family HTH domain
MDKFDERGNGAGAAVLDNDSLSPEQTPVMAGETNGEMARKLLSGTHIPLATVGARIQRLRLRQGMTIRELADRSSVDKNTIVRLEKGLPTSRATVTLVSNALGVYLGRLLSEADERETINVHRAANAGWTSHSRMARRVTPLDSSDDGSPDPQLEEFDTEEERRRMAAQGSETTFMQILQSNLPNSQMFGSVLELYGTSEARTHPGEEFVYCLNGTAKLTIGGREVILNEGDSAQFWSAEVHTYAPADEAIERGDLPVRILTVRLDAKSR